ncbi:MAG: hypothetical protein ABII90_06645 [Bacteroidota bacterium]
MADQTITSSEEMVGSGHATKSDTLNRLTLIEHHTDGTHECDKVTQHFFAADAEASDTYAITLAPVPASYTTGMMINFTANTLNTGPATINVNALGAKDLKSCTGAALLTGDILAGQMVSAIYDGTNFRIVSNFGKTPLPEGYAAYNAGHISYKDADELYIDGNKLDCAGKECFWDSQLTYDVGSPSASTWHYVYLDYSAITSGVAITTSEIINSTTAPTYSHSLKGWYNGNDRCIGCFLVDGSSNILKFYWLPTGHWLWELKVQELNAGTSATFVDVDLSSTVPNFGEMLIDIQIKSVCGAGTPAVASSIIRKNGQADDALYYQQQADVTTGADHHQHGIVQTDSSQIIEYRRNSSSTSTSIDLKGFFLTI